MIDGDEPDRDRHELIQIVRKGRMNHPDGPAGNAAVRVDLVNGQGNRLLGVLANVLVRAGEWGEVADVDRLGVGAAPAADHGE